MSKSQALILAGAVIGLILGSSMGIAAGGSAYNAAWFLTPLGAFIGWLVSNSSSRVSDQSAEETDAPVRNEEQQSTAQEPDESQTFLQQVLWSIMVLTATIWNFQIDVLRMVGLLPTFVKQPLLFLGMCVVVTVLFPPFFVIYFFAWLGANHFGLSKATSYRAVVK